MTKSEIGQKYGSLEVADSIVQAKENDEEAKATQIRVNPDMHGLDTPESWLLPTPRLFRNCPLFCDRASPFPI